MVQASGWKPANTGELEALIPTELLERIFVIASERPQPTGRCQESCGRSACGDGGSVLPLVCRRWRQVYNTSQPLHGNGTLALNLQQLEAQLSSKGDEQALLRVLAQRGQAARRLWLHAEGTQLRMAAVLQLMSPQLQAVYLGQGAPEDSLTHLHRFTALRSLDLPATAQAGSQLLSLRQLEEVTLREGASAQLLSSLASLPRLRLLSLTTSDALPLESHCQLALLTGLEELHLYFVPTHPTQFEFQPGALAGLTRLRSLMLMSPSSICETVVVGAGLPRLAALQELQVECRVESLPPDLWACQQLTRLDLDLKGSAPLPSPTIHGQPCLPALAELRLARCRLQGGALPHAVCQLSGLRRLEVSRCGLTSGCLHPALPSQFSRLSNLEHLSLEGNTLCTLPPAVAALPSLHYLDLSCNMLAWLPQGPYLTRLDTLILSANRVNQVPPVLSAAGCLEVLDLSGNAGLELTRHDVEATLARMPRLALLLLGKQAACGLGMLPAGGAGAVPHGGPEWGTTSVAALVALGQALPQLQIDFEHTAKEYEGV